LATSQNILWLYEGNDSNKKEGGFLGVGFAEVNKLLKFLL
jgi:hypothetical protein